MQRIVRAILCAIVLLGCGPRSSGRHATWVATDCSGQAAGTSGSIAFARGNELVLKRLDGTTHAVPFGGCLVEPKGLVVLADGWRALTWSYSGSGGPILTERSPGGDEVACVVDFRTRSTTAFDWHLLGDKLYKLRVSVGAKTGWLYADEISGPLRIIDVDGKRATDIPIDIEGGERVAIAERATTLRLVGTKYESIDADHPIYRHRLIVAEYDASVWPPKLRGQRELVVKGRPDRRVTSPDGRWLAHSGQPYYVGREQHGPKSTLGLVDLDAMTSTFELERPGDVTIQAVVVAGDAPLLLQQANSGEPSDYAYSLRWLDGRGAEVGPSERRFPDTFSNDVIWLAPQQQVLVKEGCDFTRIDLPISTGPRTVPQTPS